MPAPLHQTMPYRLFQGLVLAGYVGLVSALSLAPPSAFQQPAHRFAFLAFPHMDKAAHFFMYAGMSALLCWYWNPQDRGWRKAMIVLVMVTAYGFLMELLQKWTACGRAFELADGTANFIGGTAGILCWVFLHARHRPSLHHG